jgi:hypothetical protein
MKVALAALALTGCASAGSEAPLIDADQGSDAPVQIDAAPMIDAAPVCTTPTTSNILTNPAFDLTPVGMGWTETQIANNAIIVNNAPVGSDTSPNVAWMGGIAQTNATDALDQMLVIPASTTAITLTARYFIATGETVANTDTVKIGIQPMTGTTYIGPTFDATNSMATTAYTNLSITLPAAMLAGQTVRVHLTSTSGNASGNTNFFIDTLALNATYCPP